MSDLHRQEGIFYSLIWSTVCWFPQIIYIKGTQIRAPDHILQVSFLSLSSLSAILNITGISRKHWNSILKENSFTLWARPSTFYQMQICSAACRDMCFIFFKTMVPVNHDVIFLPIRATRVYQPDESRCYLSLKKHF